MDDNVPAPVECGMSESEILLQTKSFVIDNFLYMRRNKALGDDDSLLRNGIITSLGVVELVEWIESTFGPSSRPGW